MTLDHDILGWFSKSFGLFYLLALSLIVNRLARATARYDA